MSPRIPTYDSQKNFTAQTQQPLRDEVKQSFQDQQKVFGTMQDIVQKWSDANDVMQYTEAKAKYETKTADILSRSTVDPDYKDTAKYYKELEDARIDSTKGISNNQVKNKLMIEMGYGNQMTAIKIDTISKKKQIDHNQYVLDEALDAMAKKLIEASTPTEAIQISTEIDDLITYNVKSGVISEAEGKKKREQIEKAAVQYAININPDEAEKMLAQGKFQHLSPDDRVNFLKIVEAKKAQNHAELQRLYAESKKATEDALQEKLYMETLTINDLDNALSVPEAEGGADRSILSTMKKKLYDTQQEKIVNYIGIKYPESLEYVNLIDKALDKESDLIRSRQILIDAYKDGKITKEEAVVLDKIKDIATSIEIKKALPIEKQWIQAGSALKRFKELRKNLYISDKSVEEQAQDLREYLTLLSSQQDEPNKILDNIIKKRQDSNYPQYMGYEKGNTYSTILGSFDLLGRDEDGMPIVRMLNE